MSSIRFIHTADLHLDSPFKGITGLPPARLNELRNSTFAAFDRLVDYAVKTVPDFLIIVGDLYDGEDRSLRAQLKFQKGMERLYEVRVPVFISYGNHDHLGGSWTRFELPSNVHEFKGEVGEVKMSVRGQEIVLHGFSYPQRHVRQEMVSGFPVSTDREAIHIGLLHGSQAGNESHAVYSPFTLGELQSKRYDYWALGHIHERQQLSDSPPILYPGNIQGRHRNEQGKKGFYEVELSKTHTELTFIPTNVVLFASLTVSCASIRHANLFLEACREAIESFVSENGPSIIDLEIRLDAETAALYDEASDEIWLEGLRELLEGQEQFVWVQRVKRINESRANRTDNMLIEAVTAQMANWTTDEWADVLGDLYTHIRASRYLDTQTAESFQSLQERSEKLLLQEIASLK